MKIAVFRSLRPERTGHPGSTQVAQPSRLRLRSAHAGNPDLQSLSAFICGSAGESGAPDEYAVKLDDRYADRVIGNLENRPDFCTACGPDCYQCRRPYGRDFAESIVGRVAFPAVLPYVLERPEEYVPSDVPAHDVLIAVAVHEQILVECLKRCGEWGVRGVVVPIEEPGWISGSARAEAEKICARQGVEIAFPKPFCDFAPPQGSFLADFRRQFAIGRPEVEFDVQGGVIRDVQVHVSAPCGATYYIARYLKGKGLADDLRYEVVSKRLHSYPCTSSMEWDDELGDTILHVAGENHYALLDALGKDEGQRREGPTLVTPLGKAIPRPVPVAENVDNVRRAKEFVLNALAERGPLPMSELRKGKHSPAAINTALIQLGQEKKIERRGAGWCIR